MAVNFTELETKCKKAIEHYKKEISRLRTGRANPSILDGLQVEYYGTMVPLIQLGSVSAPEPRQLAIQVYDAGAIKSIEEALLKADLGSNPTRDGSTIRLNFSAPTEERRKEMVKKLKGLAEDSKVAVRGLRRDVIDLMKKSNKAKELSDDEMRRGEQEAQKIHDKWIKEIDGITSVKEKEMMEV